MGRKANGSLSRHLLERVNAMQARDWPKCRKPFDTVDLAAAAQASGTRKRLSGTVAQLLLGPHRRLDRRVVASELISKKFRIELKRVVECRRRSTTLS